jgi:hypothetical protein
VKVSRRTDGQRFSVDEGVTWRQHEHVKDEWKGHGRMKVSCGGSMEVSTWCGGSMGVSRRGPTEGSSTDDGVTWRQGSMEVSMHEKRREGGAALHSQAHPVRPVPKDLAWVHPSKHYPRGCSNCFCVCFLGWVSTINVCVG